MNVLKYIGATFSGLLVLAGCSQPTHDETPSYGSALKVQFVPENISSATEDTVDDSAIGDVTGYRFSQGVLQEITAGTSNNDGSHSFNLTGLSGDMYFVANCDRSIFEGMEQGVSTIDEFMDITAATDAMTNGMLTMTGSVTLNGGQPDMTAISLKRSVARIDIAAEDSDVEINKVTISGIADRGYVNIRQSAATPSSAETTTFSKEYATPLTGGQSSMLLYVPEQSGNAAVIEVYATFGDGMHRMTANLPATLMRNQVYKLKIHGSGADATITVTGDDWDNGSNIEATPALKGLIDTEASTLPAGVTVNAAKDTVHVSHTGAEFRLVLRAEAGSQIDIKGNVRDVTATVANTTRSLQPVEAVDITSSLRIPNEARAYMYLDIHRDDIYSGRVVVVFEPNPTKVTGMEFDYDGTCDFGKYIDGEIGRLQMPEGKTARLEFDDSEDAWMQLVETDDAIRILAGWKPNDPKADGRTQEGRIVISDMDGSNAENYTVRRINWGLPVVKIGDTWWCKYNLRGNVKDFNDQISITDDPATAHELADYLSSCDNDELLRLMGDQYQGGNLNGLPLAHNGTAFYYEGMKTSAQNIGTLAPTYMAPEGYEIPDYNDYAFFTASDNYNIGGIGTRTYKNRNGDEITVRVIERDADFLGYNYGTVAFYEFSFGGESWVLNGLGHQWDTTAGNISRMMLLFATYSTNTSCWFMEGYANAVKPNQNWLKYTGQNSTKTRTIRCIKSPVEYIYE